MCKAQAVVKMKMFSKRKLVSLTTTVLLRNNTLARDLLHSVQLTVTSQDSKFVALTSLYLLSNKRNLSTIQNYKLV